MDKLSMHDVIRDMGREIVRRESDEPGNRSRLWHPKDSFEVLREKNGTQAIEGLILDMHKLLANIPRSSKETVLETNAFARMHKLKLLRLRHVLLDGCYGELPTGLRWLCWPEFPLDSIPVDFSLEKVVFLEMQYSSLRQVFKGSKFLPSLKILDVSHSHGLTEIMDFSLCPSLEELILVDCTSLIVVHESIGNLERLVCLNMMDCKNLGMLPKNMCMLKSLEKLILSGCSNLDVFGVEMMKKIESLKVLETDVIPLSELWPERCSSILSSLPCSLVELDLSECNLSEDAFPRDFSSLSSLRRLYLDNNPISSLPNCMRDLTRLDYLSFVRCTRLQSLVGLPKGCQLMNVSCCKSLEKVTYLLDQSFNWSPERHTIGGDTDNLVEWQYWYKLEPIGRVEVEMIRLLGLCNLESLPNVRMHKLDTIYWNDSDWTPVKGLHQYGIFSTFLPGNEFFRRNEVPGWLNRKSGGSSSISFTVPLLPDHRGLNIFAVYENYINCSDSEVVDDCIYDPMTIKVSNKSKGLKWIYGPLFYGVPEEGEEMTWLSHWKMENQTLGGGDEVEVSVIMRPQIGSEGDGFRLKDFVVKLVQGQQESNINTTADPFYPCVIGGNLSLWEYLPGIYFLCSLHPFYSENLHLCTLSRGWKNLIGDSDEGADTEEKQQGDGAIVATRATGSNNFVGVCSSNNEEEKQDEDTDVTFVRFRCYFSCFSR
ncbi:unnamed protein product [Malus baccata var. baccata]